MTSGNGDSGGPTPEEVERIKQKILEEYDRMMAEKKAAEEKKEEN